MKIKAKEIKFEMGYKSEKIAIEQCCTIDQEGSFMNGEFILMADSDRPKSRIWECQYRSFGQSFIDSISLGYCSNFKEAVAVCQEKADEMVREVIDIETFDIDSICLSYRHDFGLLDADEQNKLRAECENWLRAIK